MDPEHGRKGGDTVLPLRRAGGGLLMEAALYLLLASLLVGGLWIPLGGIVETARLRTAARSLTSMAEAVETHRWLRGEWPRTAAELEVPPGARTDPWGGEYRLEPGSWSAIVALEVPPGCRADRLDTPFGARVGSRIELPAVLEGGLVQELVHEKRHVYLE
jgi:hypothetical protein